MEKVLKISRIIILDKQNKHIYTLKACQCDKEYDGNYINREDYKDFEYMECSFCHGVVKDSVKFKE